MIQWIILFAIFCVVIRMVLTTETWDEAFRSVIAERNRRRHGK